MGLIKRVGTKGLGTPSADDSTRQIPAAESSARATPPHEEDSTRRIQNQPTDEGTKQIPAASPPRLAPITPPPTPPGEIHILPTGTLLQGRYRIEEPIGVGGMSVVYRGRDMRFKDVARYCAIKEMSQSAPDSHTRALNLKNFEREAGLLATLQHPAIPKVYDFFEENHRLYLVLELVPGKDLEAVLEEAGKPISEVRVVKWAIQICDVLSYLHKHTPEPIVFRDMKPSNVMVVGDDRIVLIDFGIARNLERSDRKGTMIGTEGYSPPEQYRGVAKPQGDLYALGATLHHLLTNTDPRLETPFTFQERPIRQINTDVSVDMDMIVVKALEYDMEARWESADAMKQALLATIGAAAVPGATALPTAPAIIKSSAQTELIWKFTCEDEIRSSPAVSSGMLFVGCYDTNLYALDAARGEFRWKYATEGGINSSPAVWQDYVIVGSEDGVLYACDMRRGTVRWTFRTGKAIRSSPRIEDRVVYVGSDDQHIYAVDATRGAPIWKYRTWNPIRSSAAITNQVIFIGGDDGNVYCLDVRNGALKWKQRTQQPVRSSPVFHEGLVFVGSLDQSLYALDSEGGWPAWRFRTGHYINSSPFVFGSRVFVGGIDGFMYAIEAKNGRLAWKFEVGSQITSSPRVESGRVYFGAVDGNVYCLDAGTGTLIWKYPTDAAVVSTPAIADGIVYVGSMDHSIYALKG